MTIRTLSKDTPGLSVLGLWLEKYRATHGVSQTQLAKLTGLSQATIWRLRFTSEQLRENTLDAVAVLFGCDVEILIAASAMAAADYGESSPFERLPQPEERAETVIKPSIYVAAADFPTLPAITASGTRYRKIVVDPGYTCKLCPYLLGCRHDVLELDGHAWCEALLVVDLIN